MTLATLAFGGLLVGLCAYAGLVVFFIYGWIRRITGRAALVASAFTAAWFTAFAGFGAGPIPDLLEMSAYAAWITLLLRILGMGFAQLRDPIYRSQFAIAALVAMVYTAALVMVPLTNYRSGSITWPILLKLLLCLIGIVTLEQVARNTRRDHEWNVKFVIVGLGIVFTYGFALYADALLFNAINFKLLAPLGWIYATATPFLCIASLRNRSHRMNVNLSRRFVFRTGSLLLAGAYLLIMGTAGYYVRFFGGEWGEVFEVFLIAAGLIGLAVLALSGRLRTLLRTAIARNLYEYKYDYRDEWLRVTRELTQSSADEGLGQRAIHTMTDLLQANAGAYWRLSPEGLLLPMAQMGRNWNEPFSPAGSRALVEFFSRLDWIIDLDEYHLNRQAYAGLDLAADVDLLRGARFIVPLAIEDRLFGIIAIGPPATPMNLIWEDYDILKIIARQSAAFLALHHADSVLSASKQLRAMDQMSAFVVHDLKTINAQLGLLLRNAERHRNNPAFIDDMLKTTENAVARMTNLVDQLRTTDQPRPSVALDLASVVDQVVRERCVQSPRPVFESIRTPVCVNADRERLGAVVGHVIQNAQDATPHDGFVRVRLDATPVWAVVTITDTGHGMSPEFIERDLFAPFATTKGVAGIGVGAFQCREYIRGLGGDVAVRSQVGVGTEFTLRLPRNDARTAEQTA
ncbi:MAG TPA: XrtA/PEP-CTERM system histidine kinase PrsK [Pseudomonadales bacterium]|nr:XrtA/PEP-CTERM system histidine kinase PrsK [Pseudomonadales bacterium]